MLNDRSEQSRGSGAVSLGSDITWTVKVRPAHRLGGRMACLESADRASTSLARFSPHSDAQEAA